MRALLLPIGLLSIIGVAASAACSVSISPPVLFAGYGTCDDAQSYVVVNDNYCPGLSCGGAYYALCGGSDFDSCACDIPSGYIVASGYDLGSGPSGCTDCDISSDGGTGDDAGGDDGGSADSGGDDGGGGDAGGDDGGGFDAGGGDDGGGGGGDDSGGGGGDDAG
jgi:hypothetical protein